MLRYQREYLGEERTLSSFDRPTAWRQRHWMLVRMILRSAWLFVGVAMMFLLAATSQAQRLVPKSAEPGHVQQRLKTPEAPSTAIKPIAPLRREAIPPIAEPEERFVLSAVVIEGVTVYDPGELAPLYEEYLAREISMTDVETLLDAITSMYRNDGYILSQAVAPPQSIELGVLRVRVSEGYIGQVSFEGEMPGRESLLRAYGDKITAARPVSLGVLERYILLINDLPGVEVESSMGVLDAETGAHELILNLTHEPVQAFVGTDNRGTRSIGRYQGYAGAYLNSVLGLLERTRATFFTIPAEPRELLYFEILHEEQIGSEGTKIAILGSKSLIDAGPELESLGLESGATTIDVGISHPILRRRKDTWYVTGNFEFTNLDETILGSELFDDRLRVLRFGTSFAFIDKIDGFNFVAVEASQGLDILNASKTGASNLSRDDGTNDFTKVVVDAVRQQDLGRDFGMRLSARGQKSASPLLSSEEFGLGGSLFGRAYDSSEITGEDGAAFSVEIQYGKVLENSFLKSFQLYAFYDIGIVWNDDSDRDSLASAGGGLRANLPAGFNVTLEIAKPLTRTVAAQGDDSKDPRIFFSISSVF